MPGYKVGQSDFLQILPDELGICINVGNELFLYSFLLIRFVAASVFLFRYNIETQEATSVAVLVVWDWPSCWRRVMCPENIQWSISFVQPFLEKQVA